MLKILSPIQETVVPSARLAPRLETLAGKTVGLYSNKKLNADALLAMVAENLATLGSFSVRHGIYPPERMYSPEEWDDVETCDVVILANGDCGACSSSGLANAIELEKRGIPAFLISTPPFTEALNTMARLRGMDEIKWGIVEHPIGSALEPELRARARDAAAQFAKIMLGPGGQGAAVSAAGSA